MMTKELETYTIGAQKEQIQHFHSMEALNTLKEQSQVAAKSTAKLNFKKLYLWLVRMNIHKRLPSAGHRHYGRGNCARK